MTPKETLYGYIKDHIEVLGENLKGFMTNNSMQQELLMIKRLLEKHDEQNDKEKLALEHLCENQEKLIERRESELSEYREVIEGNFEINITEEATPDKLNECISDLIKANEKQQRILDILKTKDFHYDKLIKTKNFINYNEDMEKMLGENNYNIETDYLTQEEYDLLKEWLKDD